MILDGLDGAMEEYQQKRSRRPGSEICREIQMPTSFGKACENDDLNGSDARNILALVFTVVSVVHHYQSSKFNLLLEYIYLSGRLKPQVVATFNTFYLGDVAL